MSETKNTKNVSAPFLSTSALYRLYQKQLWGEIQYNLDYHVDDYKPASQGIRIMGVITGDKYVSIRIHTFEPGEISERLWDLLMTVCNTEASDNLGVYNRDTKNPLTNRIETELVRAVLIVFLSVTPPLYCSLQMRGNYPTTVLYYRIKTN